METFDVAVIGAGFGGVTAAALLARSGRRVALVEKMPRAGGKAQTLSWQGYRYEMFGAVGIPAVHSRFHELVDVLDVGARTPFIVPDGDIAGVRYKAASGEWRAMRGPAQQTGSPAEIENLRRVFGATDADLAALGAMFGAVMTLEGDALDALDDVGMLGWMRGFGLSAGLLSQWCGILNMLFVVPVNRLAASEAILTMRQLALGGTGRYHAGGFARVAEVCAEYVVEHGGVYRPSERVRHIVVEGGRAVGLSTAGGELRARAVVSNAGIQPTVLRLAGIEHFPGNYVARVRALEPSWAIAGVRYILDAPVIEAALVPVFSDQSWLDDERFARMCAGQWPDVPMMAIDVPTAFDPSLVPVPGHQIAITQVFTSPDPETPMTDEAIRRSEVVLDELWPDFRRHVIRAEPYGARSISRVSRDAVVPGQGGEAVGLAQVVGQCGRSKPDPRTPLPGLYLVGCDAGGRGAGTHQAVDSGFNVAAMVDADLG
ncbi:MAG: NAD(P)/FAD-dependent oxidoreductase [Candidatus Binatia bacterium]